MKYCNVENGSELYKNKYSELGLFRKYMHRIYDCLHLKNRNVYIKQILSYETIMSSS